MKRLINFRAIRALSLVFALAAAVFAPNLAMRSASAFVKDVVNASAFSYIQTSCCTTLAARGAYIYSVPTGGNFPATNSGLCSQTLPYPTQNGCFGMRVKMTKNAVTFYAALQYVSPTQINWIVPPAPAGGEDATGANTWTFEYDNAGTWTTDRSFFLNVGNALIQHVVDYQTRPTNPLLPISGGNPGISLPMTAGTLYAYKNSSGQYEPYKNPHDYSTANPTTVNNQALILVIYGSGLASGTVQGGQCGGVGQGACSSIGNGIIDYNTGNQANLTKNYGGNNGAGYYSMEQYNFVLPTTLTQGRHTFKVWQSAANEDANVSNIDFTTGNVTW